MREVDRRLFAAAAARRPHSAVDRVIPRLTTAADHGLLWFGVAAVCAATGRQGRRAALRGLVSLTVASAAANGPAKWLVRRSRPGLDGVPLVRQLRNQPGTTSFPSGHSASAAAFAAGVAMESGVLAVPVATLAAGVAYGRVHTGVHYPGDVAAGVLLGVGCALLVRRSWPPHEGPAQAAAAPASAAPAAPDGAGLVVVVNAAAASVADIADDLRTTILKRLPAAEVVLCDDAEKIGDALEASASRAQILGVAGGDGTVNCAAGVAMEHGLPLAVFPAGTLNHFAGDLGVDDVDCVLRSVAEGTAVQVQVATAGDGLHFLNTFSIGLYPELVRRREARERVVGKWPALAVALAEVLGHAEPTELEVDGRHRRVWLLFGGNGRFHPLGFAPSWRERLDEGVVDVRIVDAASPFARTRLVAAVLSGGLGRCRVYQETAVDRMRVRVLDGDPELARDGESEPAPRDLELTVDDRPLTVYRPESG
ncbi:MAG: phosphatase PAP2 family protein [Frankiaceae bacterium]|nr:phosphatase PAP2 family protein [Frankiaceae bacterium]